MSPKSVSDFLAAPVILQPKRRARSVHRVVLFPAAEFALVDQPFTDVALCGPDWDQLRQRDQCSELDVFVVPLHEK
jgi:hypothetical protein